MSAFMPGAGGREG